MKYATVQKLGAIVAIVMTMLLVLALAWVAQILAFGEVYTSLMFFIGIITGYFGGAIIMAILELDD